MTRQEYIEIKLEELETDVVVIARSLESISKSVNKKGTKITSIYHARSTRDSLVKLSNELVDKLSDLQLLKQEQKQRQKVAELL